MLIFSGVDGFDIDACEVLTILSGSAILPMCDKVKLNVPSFSTFPRCIIAITGH